MRRRPTTGVCVGIWAKLTRLRELDNERIEELANGEPVALSLVAFSGARPEAFRPGGLMALPPVQVLTLVYLVGRWLLRGGRRATIRSERCGLAVTATRVLVLEIDRRRRPRRVLREVRSCEVAVQRSGFTWAELGVGDERFWVARPYVRSLTAALAACSPSSEAM